MNSLQPAPLNRWLCTFAGVLLCLNSSAATHYVWQNSPTPTPPYTDWSTAAHTVQDAVDAATDGATVLVTNGVYTTGGRAVAGTMTNRVAIDREIRVESVNGPEATVIAGAEAPGGGRGDGAIRCVYLGTNGVLSGFTLTRGHTRRVFDSDEEQAGGGVWSELSGIVTNCVLTGNSAWQGGGAYQGTLYNCTLTGNLATVGGGAYLGTLYNCNLIGNRAVSGGGGSGGGGASRCTLYNCTLTGNSSTFDGGGAAGGVLYNCTLTGNSAGLGGGAGYATLYDCTLTGNSADTGGGANQGTLYNCTLSTNSASEGGGGARGGTLYNCTLTGNSATDSGGAASEGTLYNCVLTGNSANRAGGTWDSTLYNCTVIGNSAMDSGGGVSGGTINNCIVYFNTAPIDPNYSEGTFNYSCTTPLPDGIGNIDLDPQLASTTHLSLDSPCIGAGSASFTNGEDIDGEPWGNPPSMGADELIPGSVLGALNLNIAADYSGVVVGGALSFVAQNTGPILASVWDFGDGTVVSNAVFISHAWNSPGLYTVRLTGYNDSFPDGVSATLQVGVVEEPIYYVDQANATPLSPYISWETAATNIQDAIGVAAVAPGSLVLVTNGTYQTGGVAVHGSLTNRVALTKPVVVQSVNGPEVTMIEGAEAPGGGNGDGAVRCVYIGKNAVLSGFTLSNGHTRTSGDSTTEQSGGGVWSELSGIVTNCTLTGNSASGSGGGVRGGTLYNCTLTDNSANIVGGGAWRGTLYNCTLTGNSATWAGGAWDSTLYNCIVYFNDASTYPNHRESTFNYSCTTPLPSGVGNIDVDPQLASTAHLSSNSPCIGAGNADFASGVDIDGEPWANPPSMGADELIPGDALGKFTMNIEASYTKVAVGFAVSFVAQIEGQLATSVWDFGDGTVVSNAAFTSHAWVSPGVYTVRLIGYNDTSPEGVSTTLQVQVVEPDTYYVNQANPAPLFPYNTWQTAATSIQDAIGAAAAAGSLVLVTNGTYQTGGVAVHGSLTNRVALTKPVVVQSVNGPEVTVIEGAEAPGGGNGDRAVRCVYIGKNAVLSGFTLTNGHTRTGGMRTTEQSGGGVWSEPSAVVTNCILIGNSAYLAGGATLGGTIRNCTMTGNSADFGGGARGGTLYNSTLTGNSASHRVGGGAQEAILHQCILTGNSASSDGGGAHRGTLYNCTVTGNSADGSGGGTSQIILYNCIVYFNNANDEPNHSFSTFSYSCTTPLPPNGVGNITDEPSFVDLAVGDLHLRNDSPCIDAGTDLSSLITTDRDGNPRPLDGDGDGTAAFDMGAYEFDLRTIVPQEWFASYGLDVSDPHAVSGNPDEDPYTTYQEWVTDTDPTSDLSYFHIEDITVDSPATVWFSSSPNRNYTLWSSPELDGNDASNSLWTPVAGQIDMPGRGGLDSLTDMNTGPAQFYRISVMVP